MQTHQKQHRRRPARCCVQPSHENTEAHTAAFPIHRAPHGCGLLPKADAAACKGKDRQVGSLSIDSILTCPRPHHSQRATCGAHASSSHRGILCGGGLHVLCHNPYSTIAICVACTLTVFLAVSLCSSNGSHERERESARARAHTHTHTLSLSQEGERERELLGRHTPISSPSSSSS